MKKILTTLLLSFSLLGVHAEQTPIPGVVGGTSIHISQAPYQVALINSSGIQFCGGTIIAKNWVITAAHCLWGITPGKVTVVAGQTYRHDLVNGIHVTEVHKYPGFYDTKAGKDIALLKLAHDLDLSNPNIEAIGYTNPTHVNAGATAPGVLATLTGWGKLGSPGSNPAQLQLATMHLVSLEDALAAFKSNYGIHQLTPDQLPAWESGKSACHGDSGGPLVVPYGSSVLLAGVVSWGKDCADIAPSMFARVSSFATWIDNLVGNIDHNLPPTVGFDSPNDGDSFALGETINISANASAGNSSGYISQVSIYINGQLKAQLNNAPYQYQWQNATVGHHQLKLIATDHNNATATSQISINVVDGSSNLPPVISIVTPSQNQSFNLGEAITITAAASDHDGDITLVEFYYNNLLLSTDTQAPYHFVWQDAPVGSHQLTAVAIDDDASTTTSSAVHVTVDIADDRCLGLVPWSASEIYPRAGERVSYEGNEYENKWWTQGEIPTESGQWGVWKLIGPCS